MLNFEALTLCTQKIVFQLAKKQKQNKFQGKLKIIFLLSKYNLESYLKRDTYTWLTLNLISSIALEGLNAIKIEENKVNEKKGIIEDKDKSISSFNDLVFNIINVINPFCIIIIVFQPFVKSFEYPWTVTFLLLIGLVRFLKLIFLFRCHLQTWLDVVVNFLLLLMLLFYSS